MHRYHHPMSSGTIAARPLLPATLDIHTCIHCALHSKRRCVFPQVDNLCARGYRHARRGSDLVCGVIDGVKVGLVLGIELSVVTGLRGARCVEGVGLVA